MSENKHAILLVAIFLTSCGVVAWDVWLHEAKVQAQVSTLGTDSTRFYMGARAKVGNYAVTEVRDNLTDSCYVVVDSGLALAMSDAQPCPD